MRLRALSVCALVAVLVLPAFCPPTLAGPPSTPSPLGEDENPVVKLHFKGQNLVTAQPKPGNATEETAEAPGRPWGARMYGTVIGEWAFLPRLDFSIQGAFTATLWARSAEGAKNAGFRLNFYVGDRLVKDLYTDRKAVQTPTMFKISDSLSSDVRGGVQCRVGLVWLSDPNYFIGPSSGGEFLYGSMDHDSLVTITLAASPMDINITGYEKADKDSIRVNARVNESLGMAPDILGYRLAMTGPATVLPEHLAGPSVTASENGTLVSWLWNFRRSKAQDGLYAVTVTVSYDNDTQFLNASQVHFHFAAVKQEDFFQSLTKPQNTPMLVLVIIVGVAAGIGAGVAVRKWRRKKRARLQAEVEAVAVA